MNQRGYRGKVGDLSDARGAMGRAVSAGYPAG
jgi:hypothetical protein